MSNTVKIDDWALHAFVDGEVAGEACAEIQEALKSDAALAATVDAWRLQRDALKRGFDGVLNEPVPLKLLATMKQRRNSWTVRPLLNLAAALALLLLGGLGGYFTTGVFGGPDLTQDAIAAHQIYANEQRHAVEVAADDKDHLEKWLSARVGTRIAVPDLTPEGYTLLGGRLLSSGDKPAAQIMFEDKDKKRITVFLVANPGPAEKGVEVETVGAVTACAWYNDRVGFVVAGEMPLEPMMQLARTVYKKFEA